MYPLFLIKKFVTLIKHKIMAKVKTGFFCTKEKRSYSKGDEYKGKRTDLGEYLEQPIKENKKQPKAKIEKK